MIHAYVLLDALGPGIDTATARISRLVRECIDNLLAVDRDNVVKPA